MSDHPQPEDGPDTEDGPDAEDGPAPMEAARPGDGIAGWWQRTMFAEESTAPMAVLRITTGLIIFLWAVSVGPDVQTFFGPGALAPEGSSGDFRWGLLQWFESSSAVTGVYVALLVSSLAVIVGWHTRVAAVVSLIAMLSFGRRNPWVFNSGDLLLRHLAFYVALAPGGAALSVTAWRRHGTPWVFPRRAAWPRRLVQLQLATIYLSTVIAKSGPTWHDGTAVGYALGIQDLVRFAAPSFLLDNLLLVNLLTFGTLVVELALGVLIWNKRARPYVMLAGIGLHVGIDLTLTVGFFSYAMISMYVAFLEPDTVESWLRRARAGFGSRDRVPVSG